MARGRPKRGGRTRPGPKPDLPQGEADFLVQIPKIPVDAHDVLAFRPGMNGEIDLKDTTAVELFRVIVERSRFNSRHAKYELLARRSIVLLRYEIEGPRHRNPDGGLVQCPHLHSYREGYDDAWAKAIVGEFGDPDDLLESLHHFLRYCNVVQVPQVRVERSLFP